jgi:hypothetical protein
MPEQEELVSIRNLIDGFQRIPVKEFKGKLDSFTTELVTRFQPARTYVNLNYSEVEVIETAEPYPFPILQISMSLNIRRVSQWTILADSIAKLVSPQQDIKDTIGMVHHMKLTPGHMMWNRDERQATPRDAWEIIDLSGGMLKEKTAGNSTDRALELLDGKIEEEWNQLVFQDKVVKGDSKLIDDIIHRKFLPTMESAGRIVKDTNGVWHTKPLGG